MHRLHHTSLPLGSGGHWMSFNPLPQAEKHWAVDLLHYSAPLLAGSGQWISLSVLRHSWEAMACGAPSIHCLIANKHRVMDVL